MGRRKLIDPKFVRRNARISLADSAKLDRWMETLKIGRFPGLQAGPVETRGTGFSTLFKLMMKEFESHHPELSENDHDGPAQPTADARPEDAAAEGDPDAGRFAAPADQ